MHAARFGSEGCVLRLISHGAGRYKKDKAGRMTASDLAIAAGHLHIAGIVSADPKWLDLMEIAAQVGLPLTRCSWRVGPGWKAPEAWAFMRGWENARMEHLVRSRRQDVVINHPCTLARTLESASSIAAPLQPPTIFVSFFFFSPRFLLDVLFDRDDDRAGWCCSTAW